MLRVLWSALVLTFALVCSTGVARANGRFPQAQAILTAPGGDGQTVFLRATFGVLVSHDAGKSWQWICERALGYEGSWDAPVAMTRDGKLWVGEERGLVATTDGCGFESAPELVGETIKDLTTDPKGEILYAITGRPDKRGAFWRRAVTGAWQKLGEFPENFQPLTVEVAPSKPSRVYVSGEPYETIRGWLLHSDDGGKTWVGGKNDLVAQGPFFIADVDPKNADRVLLRHLHTVGSDVLVTKDAGKTFENVLSMKSAMFGFAKSGDGATYWAGSGLPEHGIYESKDRGAHFERVSNHGVLCLYAAPAPSNRLYVCENPSTLGAPAVAVSVDEGRTVQTLATFVDVQGPITCADGGPSTCADLWPETKALVTPREAGAPDPSRRRPLPDGGRDGGGGDAPPTTKSSCGCSILGAPQDPDHRWLTSGLLPLFVWGLARGRRGSRRSQTGP